MSTDLATITGMSRADVFALEQSMLAMPQCEIAVQHEFLDGHYRRTIRIPAGTTLTGGIHKYPNLNQLTQGEMSVRLEDGTIVHMTAPAEVMSPPGTKRIAYTHTECVWTTILKTELTDPDEIESHFIAPDETAYLEHVANLQIQGA